jgi:small multidrug resistance pump
MKWLFLILAIVFEVAGTTSMKLSDGFTNLKFSILLGIFYLLSFVFLTYSLKYFEVGLTYAIWSGVGTILIAIIGFTAFNENITTLKIVSIGFIVIGVIGLLLSEK